MAMYSLSGRSLAPQRTFAAPPLHASRMRRGVRIQANPVMQEFAKMSEEEILQEVDNCKKELFQMRIDQAVGKPVKTHMFKENRKKVAQLLTVKRQKEIEQGINKRDSRKKEKNRLLKKGFWVR